MLQDAIWRSRSGLFPPAPIRSLADLPSVCPVIQPFAPYPKERVMRRKVRCTENLSFTEKLSRLNLRMRDPEWRRYAKLLVAGKFMGLALVLMIMLAVQIVPSMLSTKSAHADTAAISATAP